MAATLSGYKARNRSRPLGGPIRVEPTNPPAASEPVEPAPVELVPVLTVMERMSKKNPQLFNLIDTLDLVEVGSAESVAPTPQHSVEPPAPVTGETGNASKPGGRLAEIAAQTFEPEQCYTRADAIDRIARQTNVSTERATNGLTLMLEQHLLSVTSSGMYYLFDTTPF